VALFLPFTLPDASTASQRGCSELAMIPVGRVMIERDHEAEEDGFARSPSRLQRKVAKEEHAMLDSPLDERHLGRVERRGGSSAGSHRLGCRG
jgi:hypothetical protein